MDDLAFDSPWMALTDQPELPAARAPAFFAELGRAPPPGLDADRRLRFVDVWKSRSAAAG